MQCLWFLNVRAILEILYFVSGVGILIVASLGLRQVRVGLQQLKLTKDLADASNRRESVKLAAQQSRYFAEFVIPAFAEMIELYRKQNLTFIDAHLNRQPPAYLLKDGKFVSTNFDAQLIKDEIPRLDNAIVTYLNAAESFAIPFAAGVASDEIGFQETSAAFCFGMNWCMPALFFYCQTQGVGYPSALTLYNIWNDRRAALVVAPFLKGLQDWLEAAGKKRIKDI